MDTALTFDQVSALASMLDPEKQLQSEAAGFAAPKTTTMKTGYSLHEASSTSTSTTNINAGMSNNNNITTASAAASPSENNNSSNSLVSKTNNNTQAPSNPGLVSLPPKLAHEQHASQQGLPVPSLTREGKEIAAAVAAATTKKPKPQGNDIWNLDEVDPSFGAAAGEASTQEQKEKTFDNKNKKKQIPDYDLVFKHNISAEDKFLGMDFTRDGSAITADAVIVKIQLPEQQTIKDVDLDVKEEELSLLSPIYQLKVSLPMKVLTVNAGATWDKNKKILSVTLKANPAKREFMLV